MVSAEITSVQYSILVILDRLGEASQRELCDEVDLDRSTIADLVRRMERRGLVARKRDQDDARRNTVTLTELGLAERRRLGPLVAAADRELTSPLTPEQLDAVRDGLRALLG
nr:MarR family winged helix-turn-helix transcriptional regulator [Microbacterium thalassium]